MNYSALLRPIESGPHGDERKVVGVWETLMIGEVEGSPREWTQTSLCRGPVDGLCSQLERHLVVGHLHHGTEVGAKEGANE